MARSMKMSVLACVFVSFLVILVLIPVVRILFPGALYDGFADVSTCNGVVCEEGQWCQDKTCKSKTWAGEQEPVGASS